MRTRKQGDPGRPVSVPGVGKMIRVARELAGGALIVEYRWPEASSGFDAPRPSHQPSSATATRLAGG